MLSVVSLSRDPSPPLRPRGSAIFGPRMLGANPHERLTSLLRRNVCPTMHGRALIAVHVEELSV